MSLAEWLSRNVAYPLWDLKDGGGRMREYRRLLSSQWSPAAQIRQTQERRLRLLIEHARATVPFYRERWNQSDKRMPSADLLESLPILTKNDVKAHADSLISTRYRRDELIEARTGGSTGVSLIVQFDERCQKFRNAAAMMSDQWAGWSPGMQLASLWGSPPRPKTIKERIRNAFLDRVVYLDTMEMSSASMAEFLQLMVRKQVKALFGHAHSLYLFAQYIRDSGAPRPALSSIVSTSMVLLPSQRSTIESVFGVQVHNRYGCEEVGLIAAECERHEGLHINAEHVVVECVDSEGLTLGPGHEGLLVLTDLNNFGMPLIRYVVGDVGVLATEPCGCGRGLPLLESIEGRTADYLLRLDGGLVSGISLVEKTLTAIDGLDQLQIVQEEVSGFRLNAVISERADSASVSRDLDSAIRAAFPGAARVDVIFCEKLEQSNSGKYRFAICNVNR